MTHRFPTQDPTHEVGYRGIGRVEGNPILETLLAIRPSGAPHELFLLKRIGNRHRQDHPLVARLLAEARTAISLRHRNIVEIHDVMAGGMSIVAEYQPGDSLEVLLARGIPVPAVCTIAHDVAAALAYAHQHQGVPFAHRALSPASILVTDLGVAKVDDFGVMRVVVSHPAAGELAPQILRYAAPESRRDHHAGTPADLYSLGAILHEALSGVRFSSNPGAAPRTTQHTLPRAAPPPSASNPHVPWQLDRLVVQLLDSDPRRRPTALEVMARLEELPRASAEQLGQWLTASPKRKARRRALEEQAIEQARVLGFAGGTQQGTPPRAEQGASPPTRQVAVRPPKHPRTATPGKGGHARGGDAWWLREPARQQEPDTQREPALQSVPTHTPVPQWANPPTETGQVLRTPAVAVQALPVGQPRSRRRAPRESAEPDGLPAPTELTAPVAAPAAPVAAPAAPVAAPPGALMMASQDSGLLVAPPTLAISLARVGPRRWLSVLTATAAIALGVAALWPALTEHAVRAGGDDLETLGQSLSRSAPAAKPAVRPTFEPILPVERTVDQAPSPVVPPAPSPVVPLAPPPVVSPGRNATVAPERRAPERASHRRIKRTGKRKKLRPLKHPAAPSVRATKEMRPQLPDL